MKEIKVQLGARSYTVFVGKETLPLLGQHLNDLVRDDRAVVITVSEVDALYGAAVRKSLLDCGIAPEVVHVADREDAKTLAAYSGVVGKLLEIKAGRGALIIALGGGCVGDLAGFVAATYMRGIRLIHVPTTLLAQVDSSIGGKTALNLPDAKNIIGVFHQPSFVLSDVAVLKTLPPREVRCGVAEMIKYGAIMDLPLLDYLELERDAILGLKEDETINAVCKAVELKAGVVTKDETESSGIRTLLNFGHTIGHAVEAAMGYKGCSHGEAVAVGMVGEMRLAEAIGIASSEDLERLEALVSSFGLPTRLRGIDPGKIIALMAYDKKVDARKLRFALPNGLGNGAVVSDPPREAIIKALKEVTSN